MQNELVDAVLEEVMKRVAPATNAGESTETAHSAVAAGELVQLPSSSAPASATRKGS